LGYDSVLRLGVITGLARESSCLDVFPAEERPFVRCAGAQSERAGILAQTLVNEGCEGLLSFGMAGGLRDSLTPGNIIVAPIVIGPKGQVYETSKVWLNRLCSIIGSDYFLTIAPMVGVDEVISNTETKKKLGLSSRAAAVDMESHIVGAVAEKAGIPFMVIRAVADPIGCSIPNWVLGNISEEGSPHYGSILAGLATHPWDFNKLLRLNRDSSLALSSLRSVANGLGPSFGLE
jgi:adenosylhomocysteine nucleosidase